MKKSSIKLAILISKWANPIRNSKNIQQFINKITIFRQDLIEQSQMDHFIEQMMKDYPEPTVRQKKTIKTQDFAKKKQQKEDIELRKQRQLLLFVNRVNHKNFDFFALQQAKQLIEDLSIEEFQAMKTYMSKLQLVLRQLQSLNQEQHIKEIIHQIFEQIQERERKNHSHNL